ncbi:DUF3489 domain-containing protein [Defluviimonas aestuarii]|uniref:DUF3489 domain-containing protein n=1 Tax=Albidovulum aestuarii TaxID=1130726 RepID=UPI00249C2344|nr:DUF3489 domain-containing protein [Defluviimonas aestuarii]MDI3335631.1 DUF3489 domain-containing protein [Defluviimonas aestuarii]
MTRPSKKSEPTTAAKPRFEQNPKPVSAPRAVTKKARLIALLGRKDGADVATISKNLGWLPHTTRAALTGLRKAGYEVTSAKPGNGKSSRYQIIAMPDADAT